MPPQWGPVWRGEWWTTRPAGSARWIAPIPLQAMDGLSAEPGRRSRTRRAGCPEGVPPGVCFFGYFLCTSKESDPLAAGEWKLCPSEVPPSTK